jgi:hypothetical protein
MPLGTEMKNLKGIGLKKSLSGKDRAKESLKVFKSLFELNKADKYFLTLLIL